MIEKVQRRATKLVSSLRELSYEERLRKLKLPTLAYRRLRDLIQVYKIMKGINDIQRESLTLFQMAAQERKLVQEVTASRFRRNTSGLNYEQTPLVLELCGRS